MIELLNFISLLITLYVYIIIAGAIMSWLIAFNVVNPYNQFVRSIWQGLNALTEPLLRPIRNVLPNWRWLGGASTARSSMMLRSPPTTSSKPWSASIPTCTRQSLLRYAVRPSGGWMRWPFPTLGSLPDAIWTTRG